MYQDNFKIVDEQIYAYLLIDRETANIIDWNHLAKEFYEETPNTFPDINDLFAPTLSGEAMTSLIKTLDFDRSVSVDNIFSFKTTDESFPCHIEICKVDDTHLFLVINESATSTDTEFADIVELTDNPIFVMEHDENLTITYRNERCRQYFDLEVQVYHCNSDSFLNILPQEKKESFLKSLEEQIYETGEFDLDIELTFGREYFQLFHLNVVKSRFDNRLYGVLISVKKQSDLLKKIEFEQQYLDIVQKFTKDVLFRIDIRKRVLIHRGDISPFIDLRLEMRNFPESMRDCRFIHPDDLEGYIAFAYRLMAGIESKIEVRLQLKSGKFEKYRLQGSPLVDVDGNTVQVVGNCENIQKMIDIENKANYDSLTTTLNKQSFKELIETSIETSVSSDKFALLFLDLDNFKGVNDTMGHAFGDFLLEAMAKRILNCIRSRDRVGRVGGDEFVIFFQFAPSYEAVMERADAILHSLRRDFTLGEQRCKVKASIGVALYPEHGSTYDILYQRADKALYKSKDKGKDVATIYSEDLET